MKWMILLGKIITVSGITVLCLILVGCGEDINLSLKAPWNGKIITVGGITVLCLILGGCGEGTSLSLKALWNEWYYYAK